MITAMSLVDWNQYRSDVADIIASRTGLRMSVDDNFGLRLFPRPALSAGRVRLSTDADGQQLTIATIDRLDMVVDLPSLITGEIAIRDMVAAGLETGLYQGADQQWRLEGMLQQNTSVGSNISFGLDRLDITNSEVRILPYGSEQPRLLRINDLTVIGRLFDAQSDIRGQFFLDRDGFELSARLQPGLAAGSQSFRFDLNYPTGLVRASGRFGGEKPFAARLQVDGSSAHTFISILSRLLTGHAALPEAGDGEIGLDASLEETSSGVNILARRLQYGRSTGRLNLQLARPSLRAGLTQAIAADADKSDNVWHLVGGGVQFAVVDAAPFVSWLVTPDTTGEALDFYLPIRGPLDIEIEALDVRGGLMQQVSAQVDLSPEQATISGFKALLPGASTLELDGVLNWHAREGGFTGEGTFSTVRLPEIAKWLGLKLPEQIPQGRLATARLSGRLALDRREWALNGFTGQLDSSQLSGRLSGRFGELVPRLVDVVADRVNAEAYGFSDVPASGCLKPDCLGISDLSADFTGNWTVAIGDVQVSSRRYQNLTSRLRITRSGVNLQQLTLSDKTGRLAVVGNLDASGSVDQLEAGVTLTDFDPRPLMVWSGLSDDLIAAFEVSPVSGQVKLSGPVARLDMSADLSASGQDLAVSIAGIAHLSNHGIALDEFQGTARHPDMSGVVGMLSGLQARTAVPVDMNISLAAAVGGTPAQLRISGEFADIRLAANLSHTQEGAIHDLRLDFAKATDLPRFFKADLPFADPAAPLRVGLVVRGAISKTDTAHMIEKIDISNGATRVAGSLNYKNGESLRGQLSVSNYAPDLQVLQAWADSRTDLAGLNLQLDMNSVYLGAQPLRAPAASLIKAGGAWQFDTGNGATMNGRPVSLNLISRNISDQNQIINVKLNQASLDVGAFLAAMGVAPVMEGMADLVGAFEVKDFSPAGWRDSLTGSITVQRMRGQLRGLDFAALGDVQSSPQTAQTLVDQLGEAIGVPSTVRRGQSSGQNTALNLQTKIDEGRIEIAANSGVLLVNSAMMAGEWGRLDYDGRFILPSGNISLVGNLQIAVDAENIAIPVSVGGRLKHPIARFDTDEFQKLALGRLQRRTRQRIFADLEAAAKNSVRSGSIALEPGSLIYQLAEPGLAILAATQQASQQAELLANLAPIQK